METAPAFQDAGAISSPAGQACESPFLLIPSGLLVFTAAILTGCRGVRPRL